MTGSLPAAPTGPDERIELLDVLRGFALLGIVIVNAPLFFESIHLAFCDVEWWPARADRVVRDGVALFAEGKFYTLFSLLFGAGLALQAGRAERRGGAADRFLARRLGWLLAIGLVHALLIWFGDILVTYALAGLLLLPLRRLSDRSLLAAGTLLVATPVILLATVVMSVELAALDPEAAQRFERMAAESAEQHADAARRAREVYPSGDFVALAGERAREVAVVWRSWPFSLPNILGLFAIGYVAGRSGRLRDPDPALLRRWLPPLAAGGLAGSALMVWGERAGNAAEPSLAGLAGQAGATFGGLALCLAYVAGIALLWRGDAWRGRLRVLAPPGRMALTNYVAQSVVFTLVANGYGLGLYGRVRPAVAVPAGLLLALLQIPVSRFWLARLRFGPLEWAWRSLTYRRRQPMVRLRQSP